MSFGTIALSSDDKPDSFVLLSMYKKLEFENAELRKLAEDLHTLAYNVLPERKSDYMTICSVESCIDYYSKTMPAIEKRMRKLGVKVTK